MENKKILIIDDDQAIVKYLEKLFKNNGYDTIFAHDGLEADDIIKEHTPALITLDLDMPNEWGTKFYRKLTKNKKYKDIPVIVVSGMAGRDNAIKKAVAIFGKPFDAEKLMAAVKEAIG